MSWLDTLWGAFLTVLRRARRGSDRSRWAAPESLAASWDERTSALAALIPPGRSILEFGAGRRTLEGFLPAGTRYTPSDLVDRGPGTLVWDLNAAELPDLTPYDVIVFSGVLEYVNDLPRLVAHLRGRAFVVASYAPVKAGGVSTFLSRRKQGWVNDLRLEEFLDLFAQQGFQAGPSRVMKGQYLFRFVSRAPAP